MRRRLALWLRERSLGAPRLNPSSTAAHAADSHAGHSRPAALSLTLGVLGVVYGDIGTSPLYALRASLLHFAADGIDRGEVLGILSLILWSLILDGHGEVRLLILRADNRGEGGILALMALAQRVARTPNGRWVVGAARHRRGLPVLRRRRHHPGHLRALGHRGPGGGLARLRGRRCCRSRSPSCSRCSWCSTAAPARWAWCSARSWRCGSSPSACSALSEIVAAAGGAGAPSRPPRRDLRSQPTRFAAFIALGSVVLAVTGAEALYADMGHFGRPPIQRVWVAASCCRRWRSTTSGRGRCCCPTRRRWRTPSSCWRRNGCACRWWCWRRPRPSSPRRP